MVSLEILALVGFCFAAYHARDVFVPVAFAGFAVLAIYPMHRVLRQSIGKAASVATCFLVVMASLSLLIGLIVLCFSQVTSDVAASALPDMTQQLHGQLPSWLAGSIESGSIGDVASGARALAASSLKASVGLALSLAFFVLLLLDADRLRSWATQKASSGVLVEATSEAAVNVRRYLIARSVVGLITGGAIALGCWGLGIKLFLVWGVLNFLLNYIPTLGSVLAVIPPALFVWTTSESVTDVALVLAVVGGVQIVMGNYVDPLVQSHFVELSPFAVLLSVVFWGWLWGIAGAFIGVPMSIALLMFCKRTSRYAWVHTAFVSQRRSSGG